MVGLFFNNIWLNVNFFKLDVLVMDIDNDYIENYDDWIIEEYLKILFLDYYFVLVISWNYMV